MDSTYEIQELKKKLKKNHIKGLALDIDETLSWTVRFWMEQMLAAFGNPENLTVRQMVGKYRYSQKVPYWQSKEVFNWIEKKRHDNDSQLEIPLIDNSNHVVDKVNKIIPVVAYITARPRDIKTGTEKWLEKHGFPKAPIIMSPSDERVEHTGKWKAGVLKSLYPVVLGIIDDNPEYLHYLDGYKGVVFLYDNNSYHHGYPDVIPCPDWCNVYQKVTEKFKIRYNMQHDRKR